jgi:hypothetical protein
MMIRTRTSAAQLAHMTESVAESYMPKKILDQRWVIEDLDEIPEIFGRTAADFVQGYRRMAEIDEEENRLHPAEENHDE